MILIVIGREVYLFVKPRNNNLDNIKAAKIIAYQRPENSGSQTWMLSLVMKDKKIKEPKKEEYIESMVGIIDAVANYDNSKDSLGYSYITMLLLCMVMKILSF